MGNPEAASGRRGEDPGGTGEADRRLGLAILEGIRRTLRAIRGDTPMRLAILAFTAAATLAGMAQPAFAQAPAGDAADARCIMVLQAVSRDPKQRGNAVRGVFFYVGKLAARGPVARVEG